MKNVHESMKRNLDFWTSIFILSPEHLYHTADTLFQVTNITDVEQIFDINQRYSIRKIKS